VAITLFYTPPNTHGELLDLGSRKSALCLFPALMFSDLPSIISSIHN
jgi:hypothetical protein